jgi:hypothetical protein
LDQLKQVAAKLDENASDPFESAIQETADALEGAQKALSEQEKQFKDKKDLQKERPRAKGDSDLQ